MSSWAHDSHNLLVMATSVELAVQAVNAVIEMQGGIAMVDAQGVELVPLAYGVSCHSSLRAAGAEILRVRSGCIPMATG